MIDLKYYERAKEILDYDPKTGEFTWNVGIGRKIKAGDLAGSLHTLGYIHIGIRVDGYRRYLKAHRIAWFIIHGDIPNLIDHKDRNRSNNIISNLRLATRSQNSSNVNHKPRGLSVYRGVTFCRDSKKWRAGIKVDGVSKFLGHFNREINAALAYDNAARIHHGEFATLNFPLKEGE